MKTLCNDYLIEKKKIDGKTLSKKYFGVQNLLNRNKKVNVK